MDIISVAKKAGFSKSTVSRVINNSGVVKASTRQKVLETMQEMGYRPNIFAQGMKTNQSRTIAVLIPDFTNPFFAPWLAAIEQVLRPHDYVTMVCSSGVNEASELASLHHLLSRRIDGLIFHSYNRHEKTLQLLQEVNGQIPIVFMDPMMKNQAFSSVFVNGFKGTLEAVQHLILKGRRRIAYLKALHEVTSDRFAGYRQAMADARIEVPEAYICEGDFSMESGIRAGEHFLALDPTPDAIVCATDNMALGVRKCLLKKRIRIPEQISLIGFDNLALTTMIEPSLSTIAIPLSEMGQKAAQILLHQITTPGADPAHVVLDCQLILRDSTP